MSRPTTKLKQDRKHSANNLPKIVSKSTELIPGTTCTENEWNKVIGREQSEDLVSDVINDFNEQLSSLLMLKCVETNKYKFAVEQFQQDIIHMFEWSHAEKDKEIDGTYFVDLDDFEPPSLMTDNLAHGSVESQCTSTFICSTPHNFNEPIIPENCTNDERVSNFKQHSVQDTKSEADEKNSDEIDNDKSLKQEKIGDEYTFKTCEEEEKKKIQSTKNSKPGHNIILNELKTEKKIKSVVDNKNLKNIITNTEIGSGNDSKLTANFLLKQEIMGTSQFMNKSYVFDGSTAHALHATINETDTNKIVKNFDTRIKQTVLPLPPALRKKQPLNNLLGNRVGTKVVITEKNIKELLVNPMKNRLKSNQKHSSANGNNNPGVQPCLNIIDAVNPSEGVTINQMNKFKTNPLRMNGNDTLMKANMKELKFVDQVKEDLSELIETDIKISTLKQYNLFPPIENSNL